MFPPAAWRTGKYEILRIIISATRQRYFVVKVSLTEGEHTVIAVGTLPILALNNRDEVCEGMTTGIVPLARSISVSIPHFALRMSLLIFMYSSEALLTI
jgi:hypothetical protein